MKSLLSVLVIGLGCLFLAGCPEDKSGSLRETKQSLQLAEQASIVVGMPAIKNFTEKRQLRIIYELRDTENLTTYTYRVDLNGKLHKVCPTTSVGFGIPYATQFTAPKASRVVYPVYPDGTQMGPGHAEEKDQPEPNGLYMPSSADATWILCLNPKTKELAPTYVEPKVIVYLFEMPSID